MVMETARKRNEGREGWEECSLDFLINMFHGHVKKGDPIDIAIIAMLLWKRGCRGNGGIPTSSTLNKEEIK